MKSWVARISSAKTLSTGAVISFHFSDFAHAISASDRVYVVDRSDPTILHGWGFVVEVYHDERRVIGDDEEANTPPYPTYDIISVQVVCKEAFVLPLSLSEEDFKALDFKAYEDEYGHEYGGVVAEVPTALAAKLSQTIGDRRESGAPVVATQIDPAPDEPSARQEVIERLDALEEAARALSGRSPMMGHNRPPEPLDDFPLTPADSSTLQALINDVRRETESETPNTVQLRAGASGLQEFASRLGQWLKRRLDKGADAFVMVLGASLAANITDLYDKLVIAWQAISNWIETLLQLL